MLPTRLPQLTGLVLLAAFAVLTIQRPTHALTQAELDTERAAWDALGWTEYEFVFQRSCFCFGDYIRPARLQIRDGQVVSATDIRNELPLDVQLFPTVDELLTELEQAIDRGADQIDVKFWVETGVPQRTFIDHSTMIADEEVFYTTRSVTNELTTLGCNLANGIACGTTFLDALAVAQNSVPPNLDFDLNFDGKVDLEDRTEFVQNRLETTFGDSNLDGRFNSSDLVLVFRGGQYEDIVPLNSTWATGDWNGDQEFNSSDLVLGLSSGYDDEARGSRAIGVPEPQNIAWVVLAGAALPWIGRGRERR